MLMVELFGADGLLLSPCCFVVEGAIVGLFIGYLATRFGGEGTATLSQAS
jgi:hypothetical protein